MPKYKLHPLVISCGMKGNKILKDHSLLLPSTAWEHGVADDLVKKGFLVAVDETTEPVEVEEVAEIEETKEVVEEVITEAAEQVAEPVGGKKKKKKG